MLKSTKSFDRKNAWWYNFNKHRSEMYNQK